MSYSGSRSVPNQIRQRLFQLNFCDRLKHDFFEARDGRVGDVPIRNSVELFVVSLRRLGVLQGRILPPGRARRRRLRVSKLLRTRAGLVTQSQLVLVSTPARCAGGTHVATRASRLSSSSRSAGRIGVDETTKRRVKNISSSVFLIPT